jgi:hypothetical protein
METIIKINVLKIKEEIKTKVELQKFYRNQMKTVHIIGERKMEASQARYKHFTNREDLRILYAVYGIARGKKYSQIENHYPEENHPLNNYQKSIDRILEKYEYLEEIPVLEKI